MARNAGRDRYIAVAKLRLAGCKVKPSCVSIRYRTAIGYRPASQTLVAMGDHLVNAKVSLKQDRREDGANPNKHRRPATLDADRFLHR